ncbi:MAG: hypothetical protein AB7O52_06245 [Planctomycetota bacterium]
MSRLFTKAAASPGVWAIHTPLALLLFIAPLILTGCVEEVERTTEEITGGQENPGPQEPGVLTEVVVSAGASLMEPGDTATLGAFAVYSNGSITDVTTTATWSVSDSSVLALNLDSAPAIEAIGAGDAEVVATFEGMESGPYSVQVTAATVNSIALTVADTSLLVGDLTTGVAIASLSDGSTTNVSEHVTWIVGNPNVVTAAAGNPATLTAVGAGNTSVLAMMSGVTSNSVSLSVQQPVVVVELTSVQITLSDALLEIGQSAQASAVGHYSDGSSQALAAGLSWSIGNPVVATIGTGNPAPVTAVGLGSTSIQASFDGLFSNVLTVAVQSPGAVALIVPGSGFTGATTEPGQIGSGAGATAKAIARFDVAPYQTFSGDFDVGVIAFHINGIDRVEISADGGPWTAVSEMTVNPRTNVAEYWARLRAQDCGTGVVEVRAIAYPNVGRPRLMPTLRLYADPNGSAPALVRYISPGGSDTSGNGTQSSPFLTARKAALSIQSASGNNRADGGIVYCLAGNNVLDGPGGQVTTVDRYVTIMPAPGLTKSQVFITNGGDALETKLMRLVDLTIKAGILSGFNADDITSGAEEAYMFAENCKFQGNGQNTEVGALGLVADTRFTAYYVVDSEVRDERHGLHRAALLRNVHCQNIGSDPFQNARFIVNCTVDGVENNQGWHPDLIQWTQPASNVIVYGLHAVNVKAQPIFAKPNTLSFNDIAFVNFLAEQTSALKSEFEPDNSNHILMWNCSLIDHTFLWTGVNHTNVSIRNSYFDKLTGSINGNFTIDNCHFRTGSAFGSGATQGGTDASLFMSPGNDDFSPKIGAALEGLMRPVPVVDPLVPLDSQGTAWATPASIGAVAVDD